ncbi:PH, RCC1 and FYVE domains-containing protein 1-like isoform X1 [Arachis stenosperma]|uniref:PH, RCC1 and FYVE domains-containing protein 1-like isoform X1 n=1 Tax=Arachis stenosperma TaxID=217475 RepID=UPI0025AB9217|nr:PH, RCC1 and FYVE domains-containing protein 1-like isoform X1 [Arachis stenosperma]
MADPQKAGPVERDIEQALTSLKKGSYLLKYGRRGKPKFCPFRLSNDESLLLWYSGKEEKQLKLSTVSKIIPGQRTATFQRYPRPEKEYQSFSLIYNDRSLDLICKDKEEAEIWFVGLKALVTRGNTNSQTWKFEPCESPYPGSPRAGTRKSAPSSSPFDPRYTNGVASDNSNQNRWVKAFSEIISYTGANKSSIQVELIPNSTLSPGSVDESSNRNSASEAVRVSLSSVVSSSSHGSCHEDFEALGDVFIWGEGIGDGIVGGGVRRVGTISNSEMDAFLPKALESKVVLDVHSISCGHKHAVLVTKQGEIFSWGEESGGRLGHGVEVDVLHPKPIETLSGINIELVACGEYHSCAVTYSGDLYTWGDGTHNSGLLGHENNVSHWIPKKVGGSLEGLHVSYVSCGPWHTAIVTSAGQLFTFGDGTFGALGHGDLNSTSIPREVEALKGLRTTRVSCGVWHTAAIVEVTHKSKESPTHSTIGTLFTWGDGDKLQLGHVGSEPTLVPERVIALDNENICRVACGHSLTIALTTSGHVYTMGSTAYGQLGCPAADGKVPTRVKDQLADCFVEDIACGSYHVAALTSKAEVYTWGKGLNGQLGHGDNDHRNKPTLVQFLKDKQVKTVVCGSNFTAVVCIHKWVSSTDHSLCSGCRNPFGFRRKRHNCYNCGLVFCKGCSNKKSIKASLAPDSNKPYRVCDDCYSKLKKASETVPLVQTPSLRSVSLHDNSKVTKLQEKLLRLSSFGSFTQSESSPSKPPESHDTHVFPSLNGKLHVGIYGPIKSSNTPSLVSKKNISVSEPAARISCQSTSPASSKCSPRQSCEDNHDDPKLKNDILTQEVIALRAQVEELTLKSKSLEAELERTSQRLKEVTAVAADEAEKCKSAKEVIKSLTAQLKEMVQGPPEGHKANADTIATSYAETTNNIRDLSLVENHTTNTIKESNSNTANRTLSNGAKAQSGKAERVVQDEPGVYITLSPLPGGGNELKRVRFSRRHFTEEEAEKWWAENGVKILERHNIVSS